MLSLAGRYSGDEPRKAARGALPRVIYDFIEGGTEVEISAGRNRTPFNDYTFVPRVLRDVRKAGLLTCVQGMTVPCRSCPSQRVCGYFSLSRRMRLLYGGQPA